MKVDIYNTDKKYNIIYADPPWAYRDKKCNGNCEEHYKTMNVEDIKKIPIKNISDNDSILFLWCTYPMLNEAQEVIKSWGFKYKTIAFQWIKKNKKSDSFFFGLGRWTRGNSECCLLATKGKPKRISNNVSQLIISPIREHSRKPDEAREKIVKLMGNLTKIELFARQEVEGWDCWGNEV